MTNQDTPAQITATTGLMNQGMEGEWFSRVVKKAIDAGFPFLNFDANGDTKIDCNGELTIFVIVPQYNGPNQGANRGLTAQTNEAQTFEVRGQIIGGGHQMTFATVLHEMMHGLGVSYEMYTQPTGYDINAGMTIMAQSNYGSQGVDNMDDPLLFNPGSLHLDAFNKMKFGWSSPRIATMKRGGLFSIPVATAQIANAPVTLFDETKGTNEFFLLEYRSRNQEGRDYDINFGQDAIRRGGAGEGLVIWHVLTNPADNLNPIINFVPGDPTLLPTGVTAYTRSILCRCPPDLNATRNEPWAGGATTPVLRWFDGAPTSTRIRVRQFAPAATSITVEILATYDTWVDFSFLPDFPLLTENGTFNFPYNTFLEGMDAVSWGGNLRIKPGTTSATVTNLNKSMTITAEGGPVTIRQP